MAGRAQHHHFLKPLELHDVGFDTDHAVCAFSLGFVLDTLKSEVTSVIKDITKLLHFPSHQRPEATHDPSAETNGIRDVSERKRDGTVTTVELAVDLLSVGTAGELQRRSIDPVSVYGRANT